jgi:hypothetical protein
MTTIARCFAALVLVASIGGCASIGARTERVVDRASSVGASEELALLRLAEKVDAAARGER